MKTARCRSNRTHSKGGATRLVVARTLLLTIGILGCGSSTEPPAPAEEFDPPLSFATIAGQWTGAVEETIVDRTVTYRAILDLGQEAHRGSKVGTFRYSDVDDPADPDRSLDCGGDLQAREAAGHLYELSERLTHGTDQCRNGIIKLSYAAEVGILAYEWYTTAGELKSTATLTRN